MTATFQKGLCRAAKFYAVMVVITLVSHTTMGWKYTFLPPPGIFPITIAVIIGLLWVILNITDLPGKKCRFQSFGELTIHGIAFLLVALFVVIFEVL